MGFEWDLNGIWMGFNGIWMGFNGIQWDLNGVWMGLNGIWMGFEWDLNGVWMGFEWDLNGILVGFEWDLNGIWMGFEWGLNGILVGFECDLNGVWMGFNGSSLDLKMVSLSLLNQEKDIIHPAIWTIHNLVGGWPTPLKNMKVKWEKCVPNIWKNRTPTSNHHGKQQVFARGYGSYLVLHLPLNPIISPHCIPINLIPSADSCPIDI